MYTYIIHLCGSTKADNSPPSQASRSRQPAKADGARDSKGPAAKSQQRYPKSRHPQPRAAPNSRRRGRKEATSTRMQCNK